MTLALATLDTQTQADGSNANSIRGTGIRRRVICRTSHVSAYGAGGWGLSGSRKGIGEQRDAPALRRVPYRRSVYLSVCLSVGLSRPAAPSRCVAPRRAQPSRVCCVVVARPGRSQSSPTTRHCLPIARPYTLAVYGCWEAAKRVIRSLLDSPRAKHWGSGEKNMQPQHRERAAPSALASQFPRPPVHPSEPAQPAPRAWLLCVHGRLGPSGTQPGRSCGEPVLGNWQETVRSGHARPGLTGSGRPREAPGHATASSEAAALTISPDSRPARPSVGVFSKWAEVGNAVSTMS